MSSADSGSADLSMELRQLIARSRPSAVRSAARASLLSPSRPSTPLCSSPSRGHSAKGAAHKAQQHATQSARRSSAKPSAAQVWRREADGREEKAETIEALQALEALQAEEAKEAKEAKEEEVVGQHLLLQEHTAVQVLASVVDACHDLGAACSSKKGFAHVYGLVDSMCACVESKGANTTYRDKAAATQRTLVGAAAALLRSRAEVAVPLQEGEGREEGENGEIEDDASVSLRASRLVLRTAGTSGCSRSALEDVCGLLFALASRGRQHDDAFRRERVLEAVVQYLLPAGSQGSGSSARSGSSSRHGSSSPSASVSPGLELELELELESESESESQAQSGQKDVEQLNRALASALGALTLVSSGNSENRQALAACGAVSRVAHLLCAQEHSVPALVEATALLRCIVDDKRSTHLFWSAQVPASLCACLASFPREPELALNCVRVLAKLTVTARGRDGVRAAPLLAALAAFHGHAEGAHMALCVRACFVLGNLTLESAAARQEAALSVELLAAVAHKHCNWRSVANRTRRRRKEQQDLLIYLVRVLANLCLDGDAGLGLLDAGASEGRCVAGPLVSMLVACNDAEAGAQEDDAEAFKTEELALNLLACLANLSFHDEAGLLPQQPGAVRAMLQHLKDASHPEAATEALRALGNFSRTDEGRSELVRAGADARCLELLQVRDNKGVGREVVLGCCGVLTNMMSVADTHVLAASRGDMRGLLHRLRRAGTSDAEVSLRACMVMHNFALMDAVAFRGSDECSALVPVLDELVDIASDMEAEEDWEPDEALSRFVGVGLALLKLCNDAKK